MLKNIFGYLVMVSLVFTPVLSWAQNSDVAQREPADSVALDLIQKESDLEWKRAQKFSDDVPWLLGAAGVSLVTAGLLQPDIRTRLDMFGHIPSSGALAGGALLLGASVFSLVTDTSSVQFRWLEGLAAASMATVSLSIFVDGSAIWARSDLTDASESDLYNLRQEERYMKFYGGSLAVASALTFVDAFRSEAPRWKFLDLRKELEHSDKLSPAERAELEARAMVILRNMRSEKGVMDRIRGSLGMTSGGVLLGMALHDRKSRIWGLHTTFAVIKIGWGLKKIIGSFGDQPLFPLLEKKGVQVDLTMSPDHGTPMMMLSGRF